MQTTDVHPVSNTNISTKSETASETITLGGGCFWCIEAVFERLQGVHGAVSGYAGGKTPNPTYQQVCTGLTGHAEVVQVSFDPAQISLETLITIFMTLHNPTTLNQQGADKGTQYRSTIMWSDPSQVPIIEKVIAQITVDQVWADPIVTEITPLLVFTEAEPEHQHYYQTHMTQGYCSVVIAPKVAKLRAQFSHLLRPV
jgi:peptide-methionine (S)-S-oxide reductase